MAEAPSAAADLRQRINRYQNGQRDEPVPPAPTVPPWPAPLDRAALAGLAGEIVGALLPHTEADEAALLTTLLAAVGNIAGSGPHWEVSGRKHGLRLWPILVGRTSKGRKGTSWGTVRAVLRAADPGWVDACVNGGLSSGEGLIFHIRDATIKFEDGVEVDADPGVADKRLFLVEEEFGGTLKIAGREGNSLSSVLRRAWDGDALATLTKASPVRATDPHVTVVGHVTAEELRRHLDDTQVASGLANRCLFVCVERSKLLPDGGALDPEITLDLSRHLAARLTLAPSIGLIHRDQDATDLWRAIYGPLSEGGAGLLGAVTSRAEAQVMRIAAICALLDGGAVIRPDHLRAAVAVWDYSAASVAHVFGERLGDPIADTILHALTGGELTQTEISTLFGRNLSAAKIARALGALVEAGLIAGEQRPSGDAGGRPAMTWRRVPRG